MTNQQKTCAYEFCTNPVINRRAKFCCKSCAALQQAKNRRHNKRGGAKKTCTYCGEKKLITVNFRQRESGRETICFDCEKVIDNQRKAWGKMALMPINGERYPRSASEKAGRAAQISPSMHLIAELAACINPKYFGALNRPTGRKRKTPAACDFGSGVGIGR